MLFPTVEFAVFFGLVFFLSWAAAPRPGLRKFILLAASYFFYGFWNWRFMFLLFEASLVNYLFGRWIEDCRGPRRRKALLGLGIFFNLAVLGFFKYQGFFMENLSSVLTGLGLSRELPVLEILLPMGISFFTFQGISYIVDVYRKEIPASRSLVDLLLYISFFPQLVAGPIVRARDFMPALREPPPDRKIRAGYAFLLIGLGLFKKVVIAHYLAVTLVEPVFAMPQSWSTVDLLLGVYGYAVQIYCDFSAYSDMAIGFAALLGFEFRKNFDQPYRARSVTEFWRRWHISLSTWLRDYLYIPLGGNRCGSWRTARNLMLTMLLGGLWHGAAWNFVFWGLLHGCALMVERRSRTLTWMPRLREWEKLVLTFHFVCLTWIFFNASNFGMATEYLLAFGNTDLPVKMATPFVLTLLGIGMAGQFLPARLIPWLEQRLAFCPVPMQGLVMGAWLVAVTAVGPGTLAPFIYFRF